MPRVLLLLVCCATAWAECRLPEPSAAAVSPNPESLLEAGQFRRAKAALTPGAKDARTLWLSSRAEVGLGHLEEALRLAEESVTLAGNKAEYHVQLAAVNGRLAEKASLFKQLGYAKRAKKELDIALELDPKNLDALYGLMLFYYAAPGLLGGDKQKATEAARRIAEIDPARGNLAQARLANDRKDLVAEEDFDRRAVAANPDSYLAKTSLAHFLLRIERPQVDAAEQLACEALRQDPSRVEAWDALAAVTVRNQCWNEMFALFERAKLFIPDDRSYYYSAGESLARLGMHFPWAEQFLLAYLAGPREGESFEAQAHWHLSEALTRLNRPDEAKGELAKAIQLDPALAKH